VKDEKQNRNLKIIMTVLVLTAVLAIFGDSEYPKNLDQKNQKTTKLKSQVRPQKKAPVRLHKGNSVTIRTPAQLQKKFNKVGSIQLKRKIIKKERTARPDGMKYESLQPDSAIAFSNSTGNRYRKLDNFYAVKKTAENAAEYQGADYKLGFFIVQSDVPIVDAFTVVENADTGALGIFTGTISIKFQEDMSQMEQLLDHGNYQINEIYDHINVVHFQFDDYQTTLHSLDIIRAHKAVKRANIEVLEFVRNQK
jgi:hypothetical protein